jgi:hypothetical protein
VTKAPHHANHGSDTVTGSAMHASPLMTTVDAAAEFSALLGEHRKIVFKVAASYAGRPTILWMHGCELQAPREPTEGGPPLMSA